MRLWSLHPKYLDTKGLLALWRETLLAQNVLAGKTKGYKNHPQLNRFKAHEQPLELMASYLKAIHEEATCRGYNFDASKILKTGTVEKISVTNGQVEYEKVHLLKKLLVRDKKLYEQLRSTKKPELHSSFYEIDGSIEDWEVVSR